MVSARSFIVVSTLLIFGVLSSSCGFGSILAPEPSATPTRTRRPTATATPTDTDTPTATSTSVNTATFTPQPPTATFTEVPATSTFTPRPPTATFTRRPPTLTFTPAPPTLTPTPAGPPCPPGLATCAIFHWIDPGHPFTANQCTFPNGTHIEGKVYRAGDGSLMKNLRAAGTMHLWIEGEGGGLYANPGTPFDFPNEIDGTWNAEFPKWPKDFTWHIFISAKASDDPVSADLSGRASGKDSCGQPGTRNFFVADWAF